MFGLFTASRLGEKDNRFDFHQHILGQPGHFHAGPSRRVLLEEGGIRLIHNGKLLHVLDKDRGFDHVCQGGPGGGGNGLDICQGLAGLGGDVGWNVTGFRVQGNLPGNEKKSAGLYGLGIGADSPRCLIRGDDCAFHVFSFGISGRLFTSPPLAPCFLAIIVNVF